MGRSLVRGEEVRWVWKNFVETIVRFQNKSELAVKGTGEKSVTLVTAVDGEMRTSYVHKVAITYIVTCISKNAKQEEQINNPPVGI